MSTSTDSLSPPIPPLPPSAATDTITREVQVTYDDRIVRRFILASGIWAAVGMLVGVFIALQLAFPDLNVAPWLSFGRLRPLHTNAVIFAFVGNMMFAGVYYSTQRLTKARTHDLFSKIHFWGWQLIIVAAALTLPLGITQGKEYAELEWPIDIAVTLIWVVFAINFFYCLYKRREKHLYVALWFYISTIVTVAVLYIVNNIALPVFAGGIKSYSAYAGAQDALVQWWYGHNAVAFFLTTPILGIMYYFLPKAAGRPVYSYRLSIIHFWALVFLYIWAGPHHLLYTSLPDWAQSLGMIFSLMLWAPSWGGMINGLLTLRGAWHLLKTDPVIKFFIAGVTFYGMATFEGPLLSIKAVSALGHYTDWIIGHVHTGALGWNGLMAAGLIYWLVPRLFGTQLYSKKAADAHFWMATLGILLYAVSMWISGIEQGLMWRATKPSGVLTHDFLETTRTIWPMYVMRAAGGLLFLAGWGVLLWNVWKTVRSGRPTDVTVTATEIVRTSVVAPHWTRIVFSPPLSFAYIGLIVMGVYFVTDVVGAAIAFAFLIFTFIIGLLVMGRHDPRMGGETVHRVLEGRPLVMTLLVTAAILVGGIAELIPTLTINKAVPLTHAASTGEVQTPYTPLELQGRDIYVREGCYTCHSQQIRPFVWERQRYGPPSVAGESRLDHPFQWGSKRTGPDLAREGTNTGRDAIWHYVHMTDPRKYSEGSVMPSYQFLEDAKIDVDDTAVKMSAMKTLGVPYTAEHIAGASQLVEIQGRRISEKLAANGIGLPWDSELTAMIAYLLRLGNQPADPIAELMAAGAPAPAGKLPGAPAAPEPTNHKATP